jgi:hypothetical protein
MFDESLAAGQHGLFLKIQRCVVDIPYCDCVMTIIDFATMLMHRQVAIPTLSPSYVMLNKLLDLLFTINNLTLNKLITHQWKL